MKWLIWAAIGGLVLWGAVWLGVRLGRVGGEAPLPAAVQAWQSRLQGQAQGQQVHVNRFKIVPATLGDLYAARCELQPSGRALVLIAFDNVDHAQSHLAYLRRSPEEALTRAQGRWVLRLTAWPADDPLTRAVLADFADFAAHTSP